MHAKYEVSISYDSKVIAKVKVDNRQTDKQTDKQTGQKQYAPDQLIRGHKNVPPSPTPLGHEHQYYSLIDPMNKIFKQNRPILQAEVSCTDRSYRRPT